MHRGWVVAHHERAHACRPAVAHCRPDPRERREALSGRYSAAAGWRASASRISARRRAGVTGRVVDLDPERLERVLDRRSDRGRRPMRPPSPPPRAAGRPIPRVSGLFGVCTRLGFVWHLCEFGFVRRQRLLGGRPHVSGSFDNGEARVHSDGAAVVVRAHGSEGPLGVSGSWVTAGSGSFGFCDGPWLVLKAPFLMLPIFGGGNRSLTIRR